MKRDYTLYLKDILECIEKIESFIELLDYKQFVQDDKTCSAVIRKLEIIGEAVKHLPDTITDTYPEVPWKDMARMRDKFIHFYFGVDYEVVWKVAVERLPDVKNRIKKILGNML